MEQIIIVLEGEFVSLSQHENVSMDSLLDTLGHDVEVLASEYDAKSYIDDVKYVGLIEGEV